MNIKEFLKNNWPWITFLIISIVCALFWTRNGNIYGTDDSFSLFRDKKFLERGLYFWEDQKSFGSFNVGFTRIPFYLFEYILNNNFFSHTIFYFSNVFLSLLFCFLLANYSFSKFNFKVKERYLAFFISLFYVFSPFNYYYTFQDQTGYQPLLAFIPFVIFFSLKVLFEKNPINNILILFLGSLYFGLGISHITLFTLFLFSALIGVLILRRLSVKRVILLITMIFLLWSWFLIPFLVSIYPSISLANKGGLANNLILFSSQYNTIPNVIRFIGYSPINFMVQHNGVMLNQEGEYYKGNIFMLLSIITFLIIFISLIKNRNNKSHLSLGLILIIILFFISNISTSLISRIPILKFAFRNAFHKFALYYELIFSFLIVISLDNLFKNNKIKLSLLVIILITFMFPFFISSPIYRGGIINSYYVSVPGDYYEFYYSSNINNLSNQKILVLPLNMYGTTFFNWASPVESLIIDQFTENKVSSIKYINEASNNITDSFWNSILKENYKEFDSYLSKYKISSIIFDNNINWEYYTDLNQNDPIAISKQKYQSLMDYLKINYRYNTFGNITEILINKKYSTVEIKNSFYEKINPTKYKIYIENMQSSQDLSFLESYHKDWYLYLAKKPSSEWCTSLEFYEEVQTTECEHTQKFFEGEELKYLWEKPAFDDSHQMVYDYANGWTINPQYIKDNYSKDYYTENEDGSINIEFVMYFKPQSYFYLGIIISVITLTGCIFYIIYNWRKSKTQTLKTTN